MSACQELIVIIRPSFKKFCGGDACRAALFNHLLYWIAQKAKGHDKAAVQAGEVTWYGTAEEIHAGLDGSWSLGKVRREIKALVEAGLIKQSRNPVQGWDKTWHYSIGLEQGKAIKEACEKFDICLLHLGLRPDVLHLLSTVKALSKKCSCQIEQTEVASEVDGDSDSSNIEVPNVGDRSVKNGRAIPKDTPRFSPKVYRKDDSKGESTASSANDHSSLSDLDVWIEEKKIRLSRDKNAVHEQKQELMGDITTRERFEDVYRMASEEVNQPGKDGIVRLGNLVSLLPQCRLQWQEQEAQDRNAPMTHEQAEAFAQRLMQHGWASAILGLEQPYGPTRDIWTLCIQYAEGEWLPFGNENHFNDPSRWERDRIQQALAYAQHLQAA